MQVNIAKSTLIFYNYLSLRNYPNTSTKLNVDNIEQTLDLFSQKTNDLFFKDIFVHSKAYIDILKQYIQVVDEMQIKTVEQARKLFVEIINNSREMGLAYHKLIKELSVELIGEKDQFDIYDPTMGFGSFLIYANKKYNISKFYGEEIDLASLNIAKMQFILHGIMKDKIDFKQNDVIINPTLRNELYDVIISEPPYDIEPEAMKSYASKELLYKVRLYKSSVRELLDYSFIFHGLKLLKHDGIYITVASPSLIFKEKSSKIRKKLVYDDNVLDCIIKLPSSPHSKFNMSLYILIFKKNRNTGAGVFAIDLSDKTIEIKTNKSNIDSIKSEILEIYKGKKEIDKISKFIQPSEFESEGYNFNLSRYIIKNTYKKMKPLEVLQAENLAYQRQIDYSNERMKMIFKYIL